MSQGHEHEHDRHKIVTHTRSATNSMYCVIKFAFMPIRLTGNASVTKSRSIATACHNQVNVISL